MAKVSEMREQLERLLVDQISLADFSKWFVPNTWNAHLDSEQHAREFADAIDDVLVEFDGDSPELRQSLLDVLCSYEEPSFFANSYGDSNQIAQSNSENPEDALNCAVA